MLVSFFNWRPKTDDLSGQDDAVQWLRASVLTETGPAFLSTDRRKCQHILNYIDRLEKGKASGTT